MSDIEKLMKAVQGFIDCLADEDDSKIKPERMPQRMPEQKPDGKVEHCRSCEGCDSQKNHCESFLDARVSNNADKLIDKLTAKTIKPDAKSPEKPAAKAEPKSKSKYITVEYDVEDPLHAHVIGPKPDEDGLRDAVMALVVAMSKLQADDSDDSHVAIASDILDCLNGRRIKRLLEVIGGVL